LKTLFEIHDLPATRQSRRALLTDPLKGAVKHGAADPADGKNVVLHEFAHQLDFENDAVDGVPGLATREHPVAWADVMRSEFASLRAADEGGIPTLLDTYD